MSDKNYKNKSNYKEDDDVLVETDTKAEYPYKNFLEPRKVIVSPIRKPDKWSMISKDVKDDAFLFNKCKNEFVVPISISRGGALVQVLDNSQKYYTPEFPNEALTETEFFSKILGEDLSIYRKENNFWKTNPVASVTLDKNIKRLDLSIPNDYIKYKVLLANSETIAPYDGAKYQKATYRFVIIDETEKASKETDLNEIKDKAYHYYLSIKDNVEKLKNYLKISGRTPSSDELKFLRTEVAALRDANPKEFLEIAKDPNADTKLLMHNAIRIQAIVKVARDSYSLSSGVSLGNFIETLKFLNDPNNHEIRLKIEERVEEAKKEKLI